MRNVTAGAFKDKSRGVVPTGLAAGGNEIISAPEFQRNAFSESGYFRKSRWAGNYEVIVAGKGYVTRYGEG